MPIPCDAFLRLESVCFSYRALPVVRGLDWTWQAGEQWCCVGPNGAGKSTLAGLISRQLGHGSGRILRSHSLEAGTCSYVCFEQQKTLCDRDRRLDDSEFRSDASDPGTTVAAALGAGLESPDSSEWIDRLAVGHILNRGIRFISTGEMRKTLLLRAILQQPTLLILDSPLDGLDRASQAAMSGIIEQLLVSKLRVLMLARKLTDIPAGITHLLVLDAGEVVAAGPRDEVLELPEVEALMNPAPLSLGSLPEPARRPYDLEPGEPLLELRDVSVSYGDTLVLDRVSWTLLPHQHSNIAGPNGCGKTTLLSLVTGDNHKAYGQDISLFGRRRGSGESVWDIKQKIGQVDTQMHLKHSKGMRVLEVVVSGFFDTVGLYDDWGGKQVEIARDWLRALGLGGMERVPFDTLSFGIQRMVLLARAMVKSPAILILDEPCLGLDAFHTGTILDAVDHIAANCDTRVVYVSHSIGELPGCINQWLEFSPREGGFDLDCREAD
jgi:molybdate transport system ATP-binding protein